MKPRLLCQDCHTTIAVGDPLAEPRYGVCPKCRSRRGALSRHQTLRKHGYTLNRKEDSDARRG